jgi:hypothetical protein
VNSLVARDREIRLGAQERSYDQSVYQLDYTDTPVSAVTVSFASWWAEWRWFDAALLALIVAVVLLGRRRAGRSERRLAPLR